MRGADEDGQQLMVFFRGVAKEDFDEIWGKFPEAELLEGEDEVCSDRPYHDGYEELIPDHLFSNSNLPIAKHMEGEYIEKLANT